MHPADSIENIIEVKDVSFSYDGNDSVLDHVTLSIHRGDYIAFVGPNGSGKTTLLKIILHLLLPQSGTVTLFGSDLGSFKEWHRVGYVPQKPAHFDRHFPASVFEVVLMGRYSSTKLFRRTTQADRESVQNALENVGMWEYRDRLIGDLSGGQQQRVFIARALVNSPEIIFLDEPTTGVDAKTQDDFYALLKKLNEELNITLVLVSHDIERITREAMHIACINRTLTCHVSPEEYAAASNAVFHHHRM